MTNWTGSRSAPDAHHCEKSDPHQIRIRIRIHIKVISRIRTRFRINVMWIHNNGLIFGKSENLPSMICVRNKAADSLFF